MLAAELLTALDFLRCRARGALITEIEDVDATFLPDQLMLPTQRPWVTDRWPCSRAMITSPSCQVLIEAKRLRRSRFHPTRLSVPRAHRHWR